MATDFTYGSKTIVTTGGVRPAKKDTPLDVRTRVNLKDDIKTIPNPFIGMHILVLKDETNKNEMTEYIVKSLKANALGVPNALVDEMVLYKDFLGIQAGSIDYEIATEEELLAMYESDI